MEVGELGPFVIMLVLTSVLLGAGVLVLGSFQSEIYDETTVINESHTLVSGDTTLNNGNVLAVSSIENSTAKFVYPTHLNFSANGTVDSSINGSGPYNITYTYDKNNTASVALGLSVEALTPVASTWLPLIVTIASLAIILFLVIRAFSGRSR